MGNEIAMQNSEVNARGMESLLEAVRLTTMNVNSMSQQLGILSSGLADHETRLTSLEHTVQEKVILDEDQLAFVQAAIDSRVANLLGLKKADNDLWEDWCIDDYKKYFGKFRRKLIGDGKRVRIFAHEYKRTPHGRYDDILQYVAAWQPACGVDAYKEYLDKLAK